MGASTSPVLIAEWQEAQLDSSLQQNGYGDPRAPLLKRNAEGDVVFAPLTAQDHVATPFVPVKSGMDALELVLETDAPAGDACAANLQDQRFNVLATLPCAGSGEQKMTAQVPGGVTQVRVFFQSAKLQTQQLPSRIQLLARKG